MREVDSPQGEDGGRENRTENYPSVSLTLDSSPDKGSLWGFSSESKNIKGRKINVTEWHCRNIYS